MFNLFINSLIEAKIIKAVTITIPIEVIITETFSHSTSMYATEFVVYFMKLILY